MTEETDEHSSAPWAEEPAGPPRPKEPTFLTETTFDHFDLPQEVAAGLREAGFTHCTPIQAQALPVGLEGRDVAGQAQTGTGKTLAFLLPLLTRLLKLTDRRAGLPSALVIAPTRELALQIYEDAELVGRYTGLSMGLVIGGIDYKKQADMLRKGVDIVICTPGRLIDYLKQGIFKATKISSLVIDEADRLMDMGFINDLRYILRHLPPFTQRQTMLFSATLAYRILELTYEYMNTPEFISVTPDRADMERIEQSLIHVGTDEKLSLLLGILRREEWTRVLIFANTKSGVEWVSRKLKGNGFPAEGITGDLPQPTRLKLMKRFKDGELKILVATDVASRGIHVEDISHVINYDLPQDAENYVHRIGRTARLGKTGRAISLACETYVLHLQPLEEYLGYKLPVVWPEDDWFEKDAAGPVRVRDLRMGAGGAGGRSRPGGRGERPSPRGRSSARPGEERRPSREPSSAAPGEERRPPRGKPSATPGEERRPPRGKPSARTVVSTRSGGVFGLAPGSYAAPAAEKALPETKGLVPEAGESEAAQKKKKKRRRRKKKPGTESAAAAVQA